jgi:superfamily II DNA/RNA helicase
MMWRFYHQQEAEKHWLFYYRSLSDWIQTYSEVQALVLVPSRELAMQIEQVARKLGSGFKINAVYGGRSGALDKADLKHRPALLIGTPGRIADRFRRDDIDLTRIKTLVLDEFDKSLEVGFEREMSEIVRSLGAVEQRVLTSATDAVAIPKFLAFKRPINDRLFKPAPTSVNGEDHCSARRETIGYPALSG